MSEDRLDRLENIVESNARAIQALTNEWQEDRQQWEKDRQQWEKDRQQWEKDRQGIYQLLGRLTHSMADFYETQADFYNRFDKVEERQLRMLEILDRLHPRDNN